MRRNRRRFLLACALTHLLCTHAWALKVRSATWISTTVNNPIISLGIQVKFINEGSDLQPSAVTLELVPPSPAASIPLGATRTLTLGANLRAAKRGLGWEFTTNETTSLIAPGTKLKVTVEPQKVSFMEPLSPTDGAPSQASCAAVSALTVRSGDRFAILSSSLQPDLGNATTVFDITKKVFQCFQDTFDFVFVVSNTAQNFNQYNMSAVTNYRPASFGSAARLMSVSVFPRRWDVAYGATLHELAHTWANDILPTWGYDFERDASGRLVSPRRAVVFEAGYSPPAGGTGACSDQQNRCGHWGLLTPGGSLGGFRAANLEADGGTYLVKQRFGTVTSNNSTPYSVLELYLMGLAQKAELADGGVTVYQNPTFAADGGGFVTRYRADGGAYDSLSAVPMSTSYVTETWPRFAATPRHYSADAIEGLLRAKADGGASRLPEYSAQRAYRVLAVLVTDGSGVTEDQRNELNGQLAWFTHKGDGADFAKSFPARFPPPPGGNSQAVDSALRELNNFWMATRGRGTLEVGDLALSLKPASEAPPVAGVSAPTAVAAPAPEATLAPVRESGVVSNTPPPKGAIKVGNDFTKLGLSGRDWTAYYGKATTWLVRSGSGMHALPCEPGSFGGVDPLPSVAKACFVVGSPSVVRSCGADFQTCRHSGAGTVVYGVYGRQSTKKVKAAGSLKCEPATFGGDPAPNIPKNCYFFPRP